MSIADPIVVKNNLHKMGVEWGKRIQQWREEDQKHTEKSFAQQYWSDLLRCFEISPERIDLFERDATRATTGNTGYIDLFWSGVVLGEAKSLGKDLDAAFEQAMDYLSGGTIKDHEFPRYVLTTDFENLHVHRLGGDKAVTKIHISQLGDYFDQLKFFIGLDTISSHEGETANLVAAKLMADLYTSMVGDDADTDLAETSEQEDESTHTASIMMTRLLFLMYGDDAGLWENDLFYRWVEQETQESSLGAQLHSLFTHLNTPDEKRSARVSGLLAKFPYVNGGVFADDLPIEYFTENTRDKLLDACRFQWTNISPAVFGALFQLVKSKEARRDDGEHYTSEENILKTLGPLFLDEWEEKTSALESGASVTAKKVRDFHNSLATHIFVDPACGAGNFLNLAYAKLREIETRLLVRLRELEGQATVSMDQTVDQKLTIDQFYGFEINWWPAKIAETAMFLVDHQANRKLAQAVGVAPDRLPIEITAHIYHVNALQVQWSDLLPEVSGTTYVFGNPPFIGQYTKTAEQTADMKRVWGSDYDGYLDYVTGWHAQARTLFEGRHGEFAYVTTNSITQGQPVTALFEPLYRDGWNIKFAWRTFPWDSQAPGQAAVHCVIVGFTRSVIGDGRNGTYKQRLWDETGKEVKLSEGINAYLLDAPFVFVKKRSRPLSTEVAPARFGSKPVDGGKNGQGLIVEVDEVDEVRHDPIAAKYLRQYVGASELVKGLDRWCLWMADSDFNPADIQRSPVLKKRLAHVASFRQSSAKEKTRETAATPHLFRENHQPNTEYVGIPRVVSENRGYYTAKRLGPDVIASDACFTVEDPGGLLFALISSSMFITWQKAIGGRLKSDTRFANTLTWNNFPVPELSEKERAAIIAGGKKVEEARALYPDRSLADAYNPLAMDPALVKAHNALDSVVDKAFGASRRLDRGNSRLQLLFENYLKLTSV